MWYTPNAYKNIPKTKYDANIGKREGANPSVIGGLAALLTVASVVGISCNRPNGKTVDSTVNLAELQPYQIEFLKKWKAEGKPYMFENHPEAEKHFSEKGYNPRNFTDAQALEALEWSRNLARLAGIRLPEDFK